MTSPRDATAADIAGLVALEQACFSLDAQSRRSLRWLVLRARACFRLIEASDATLAAYAVTLFRANSRVARLYSIAVAPSARGQGHAAALLADAQIQARAKRAEVMRAEARWSNAGSRGLFRAAGFHETTRLPDYYPGPEDGIRLEKNLRLA